MLMCDTRLASLTNHFLTTSLIPSLKNPHQSRKWFFLDLVSNSTNKISMDWAVFLFFFNFLLYFGVHQINNNVIVSGGQQKDSAIHIHVSIFPQTPFPSRLPHNIEQSSLCYTTGPCWLSIFSRAVCTRPSQII